MTSKGHEKAVNKVKQWKSEVDKAFKGTEYEDLMDSNKSYDDTYELRDLKYGKNGYHEKTIAKIPGSHLASDYHGKDKEQFLKLAGQGIKPYRKNKKGLPIIQGRSLNSYKNIRHNPFDDQEVSRVSDDYDPMAFNYNYRSLTRKRKEKKLPYYMSSRESYYDHIRRK